jgi:hypothetical protein
MPIFADAQRPGAWRQAGAPQHFSAKILNFLYGKIITRAMLRLRQTPRYGQVCSSTYFIFIVLRDYFSQVVREKSCCSGYLVIPKGET